MENKVIARFSRDSLWIFLIALLIADYVCIDVIFFHSIPIDPPPQIDSFGFGAIFAVLFVFTGCVTKQLFFPTNILTADQFGVELHYRMFKSKIRIPWDKVIEIKTGKHVFAYAQVKGSGRVSIRDAIEIFFDDSIDLGTLGEAMAHPENRHAIVIAGHLFVDGIDNAAKALHSLRSKAVHSNS